MTWLGWARSQLQFNCSHWKTLCSFSRMICTYYTMKTFERITLDGVPPGDSIIQTVREHGPTCLLAFSRGKDSILTYLRIKDHFDRVIPFYRYTVPGLQFVEESLVYFEENLFDGEHIVRIPHRAVYHRLRNYTFQPPHNYPVIRSANIPRLEYEDITNIMIEELGLPADIWTAVGVRAGDNLQRWRTVRDYGAIRWKRRQFYPAWDIKKDEMLYLIKDAGIRLPVDYQWFGRSLDGIAAEYSFHIKQHAPDDYDKLLELTPLMMLDLARHAFFVEGRERGYDAADEI